MMDNKCSRCGHPLTPNQAFCSNCGASLKTSGAQSNQVSNNGRLSPTRLSTSRPSGVTIIAILQGIGALFFILLGVLFASNKLELPDGFAFELDILSGIIIDPSQLSTLFFILGLLSILISYGLWTGKAYSRTLFLALNVISMLTISTIIINAIMIMYMVRPNVKEYFSAKKTYSPTQISYEFSTPKSTEPIKPNKKDDKNIPNQPIIIENREKSGKFVQQTNSNNQITSQPTHKMDQSVELPKKTLQSEWILATEILNEYSSLKKSYETGTLSEEEFSTKINAMRYKDSSNNFWTIGRDSGVWYIFKEKKWTPGNPPSMLSKQF